ncbi:MAG: hypothetical protein A3C43_07365 [Candidatus Schekmanbacteria bacterium RIFCSPHIGHO2_02_FULL_38_11]|uniref:DUF6677 domain-containing protein n=1 Tax=Candidatus Schekmanbacteria bacterium RIFCSPLOWO2_12_FULL_38_15 TaxID=1817883 RepID=A0A1F7SL88_9BACT|nr:MAG: hypothetical protein A2043_07020 [Candidatus Schekmanbacteria bacterium GWA2_38_9]OGL47994.1 MAG: hypothetical protein A3H37_08190 [Candidatus Schekmanbacteria bacterium RIFCSPLOWO2_02_FULL_38_14]OGL48432.1 MAG: hypothetical protein A3C43_07365 [Candidatus Schekmanbacteria bacterium RIFCSPHIGHO2_02_FULL_38_11]OGL54521.1 MAG: hypothetical protein A3G31_10200 [Candidatus Schekmanbacteria bacterium RIFCSPLOWO2_12_FULL_38_15]
MEDYAEKISERKSLLMTFTLAFLIPGGGHFYLGKRWRSLAIFSAITLLSLLGLQFFGGFFTPQGEMSDQSFAKVFVLLSVFVQLFNGIIYLILAGFKSSAHVRGIPGMMEIGGTFIIIAGLLNILIIMDAYDIAMNKKG